MSSTSSLPGAVSSSQVNRKAPLPLSLALMLSFYIGVVLFCLSLFHTMLNESVLDLIKNYWMLAVGTTLIMGVYIYYLLRITRRQRTFISIDEKMKQAFNETPITAVTENLEVSADIETPLISVKPNNADKFSHTLESYLTTVTDALEKKSSLADEKASILLDKGTGYTRLGIGFYLTAIIAWQIVAKIEGGIKPQIVYGVVSCSFLFVFIEFLSAWFLKQYRHFVDTSTYLTKVKSIFDKYMMMILYSKGLSDPCELSERIVTLLGEEIKWPDISRFNREDVSFAKEALETVSLMLKNIRGFTESKEKNDEK